MKIKDYLKDKLYLITAYAILSITLFFILDTLNFENEVIFIVLLALFLLFMIVMYTEYKRRSKYYKYLLATLENLDDPYLIFEMFSKNNFLDAKIFEKVVRVSNTAMVEKVGIYRSLQEDYKSYIELWVHEVKTPLAAAKLIVENSDQDLSHLASELDEVSNFVQQALFYARSNAVSKDYIIKETSLDKSINKVIKSLSNKFINKNIKINLDLSNTKVYTDSKWFEFILKQILINSLQYTKQNGEVSIKMIKQKQSVKLVIKDNGIGVSSEDLDRIYEKGFTGASGRTYSQATGIGLYLVKQLADALNIKVEAESNDGFTIFLTFPQGDMHFKV